MVVSDRRNRPGGRNPLSRSSSHSCPSRPFRRTALSPGFSSATSVSRQKRKAAYSAGTMRGSLRPRVHGEDGARQGILGLCSFRIERPRVAPSPRPNVGDGVDLGAVVRLLVGDQRPVSAGRPVAALLPTGLPEHLVAAEKGEVNARVTGGLNVSPLVARPVLVVANRQEQAVLQDLLTAAVTVDTGEVADVVSVRLEKGGRRGTRR